MAKGIKDHTFSLVEYLMIVMIIGILIVFIVPFTQANKAQPKIREMKNNVNSILNAYDQTGVIEELKLSEVGELNNNEIKYSIEVNDFLKYVNFEKDFAKNLMSFTKKKAYLTFLKDDVRPLVKVAYLSSYDKYISDLALVKLKFDYDVLPNLGSFLEDDKFFEFYDLAQSKLIEFVIPGLEDRFDTDVVQLITFIKGLKPVNNQYQLTYDQIKKVNNINLVDLSKVEDKYFSYKLNRDSTIVATTTENFGTAGAQIIYNMTDELYEVGPRSAYSALGATFLEESIAKLPALTQERDVAISNLENQISPEEFDLSIALIPANDKELFLSFEAYLKDNFRYQDISIYTDFYKNFNSLIASTLANNRTSLVSSVESHDKMNNPTDKVKSDISEKVENWEKLNLVKAKLDSRIKSLNEIEKLINKVQTAERHQSLKENYLKSFNVIDQDWLILE